MRRMDIETSVSRDSDKRLQPQDKPSSTAESISMLSSVHAWFKDSSTSSFAFAVIILVAALKVAVVLLAYILFTRSSSVAAVEEKVGPSTFTTVDSNGQISFDQGRNLYELIVRTTENSRANAGLFTMDISTPVPMKDKSFEVLQQF